MSSQPWIYWENTAFHEEGFQWVVESADGACVAIADSEVIAKTIVTRVNAQREKRCGNCGVFITDIDKIGKGGTVNDLCNNCYDDWCRSELNTHP